jgi:hypothetical protein
MRTVLVGLLLVLAACRQQPLRVKHQEPIIPAGQAPPLANSQRLPEEHMELAGETARELEVWSRTVLEYADSVSLLRMKDDTLAVLKLLDEQYREAGTHRPYVMIDYRNHLRERIAYEAERLRLIEGKLTPK